MPVVGDLVRALDAIAPFRLAEEWDNVGLLLGSERWSADKALFTIDLTPAVVDEALRLGVQAVVAYHPPIFRPLRRLTDAAPTEHAILALAERSIAIVSPHTALDAAPGGLTDWIAEGVGAGDLRALVPHAALPSTEETKVITYCPETAVDRLRDALAAVGAGRIGDYERCSFELRGVGTFFGREGASPSVGSAGRLERVNEARLEMVCPRQALALAVETIRQFHPYEEAPIEIHALERRPMRGEGCGRRLTLDAPIPIATIVERLKSRFGVAALHVAQSEPAPQRHATIGICAGAGASLVDPAIAQGCTLFITGELKHHETLAALSRGCSVVLAGHTNSERGYLPILAMRLGERVPGLECVVSTVDRDPLAAM